MVPERSGGVCWLRACAETEGERASYSFILPQIIRDIQ